MIERYKPTKTLRTAFVSSGLRPAGTAIWLPWIGAATIIDPTMVGTSKEATASTSDPKKIIG